MTCLVTGGAGFIGAHVSRELLKLGQKVVILDDLSGGFEENIPQNVLFVKGSITDTALLAGFLFIPLYFYYSTALKIKVDLCFCRSFGNECAHSFRSLR